MPIWQARFTAIKLAKYKSNINYDNFGGAIADLVQELNGQFKATNEGLLLGVFGSSILWLMAYLIKQGNKMNFPRITLLIVIFFLVGCGKSKIEELESQISDLQAQVYNLQDKLKNAHSHANQLESEFNDLKKASDEIKDTASQFDEENWKDIVPQIQRAASDLELKITSLESSITNTVSALE